MRPISGFDKYLSKVTCANFGDFLLKRTFKPLRQRTISDVAGRSQEENICSGHASSGD